MSKAIRQTLAAIKPHQAVLIGKEAPAKTPKGAVLLTFGKSYALQPETTSIISELPGKISAAFKFLIAEGGIITKKIVTAAELDWAALVAKLQGNGTVTVNTLSASKISVTPKAKRADLIQVGQAPAAKPAKAKVAAKPAPKVKATKAAPVKAAKKATSGKSEPKASKAKAKASAPAKVAPKAVKGKPTKAVVAPVKKRGRPAKVVPVAKKASKPAAKAIKGKPAKGKKGK